MTKLQETTHDVAMLRLALSVTRYWAREMAEELEKWLDYAEGGGDAHPTARANLEKFKAQEAHLEQICPLAPASPEDVEKL